MSKSIASNEQQNDCFRVTSKYHVIPDFCICLQARILKWGLNYLSILLNQTSHWQQLVPIKNFYLLFKMMYVCLLYIDINNALPWLYYRRLTTLCICDFGQYTFNGLDIILYTVSSRSLKGNRVNKTKHLRKTTSYNW
jgi:hypothetical protein